MSNRDTVGRTPRFSTFTDQYKKLKSQLKPGAAPADAAAQHPQGTQQPPALAPDAANLLPAQNDAQDPAAQNPHAVGYVSFMATKFQGDIVDFLTSESAAEQKAPAKEKPRNKPRLPQLQLGIRLSKITKHGEGTKTPRETKSTRSGTDNIPERPTSPAPYARSGGSEQPPNTWSINSPRKVVEREKTQWLASPRQALPTVASETSNTSPARPTEDSPSQSSTSSDDGAALIAAALPVSNHSPAAPTTDRDARSADADNGLARVDALLASVGGIKTLESNDSSDSEEDLDELLRLLSTDSKVEPSTSSSPYREEKKPQ